MNFEKSFERLEVILEKMNSGKTELDDSINLYEEADKLIHTCNQCLVEAEKKIEVLTKKRNGEIETDAENKPITEEM